MSRTVAISLLLACRFPRVSGDEPGVSAPISAAVVFSPRERG